MKVYLADLVNNPFRDFRIDPIENESVKNLTKSIEEDGFWGGVVCRKVGDEIQIAAGHHRVKAALKAGIEEADLFVSKDMDDAAMVRIYARENALQRGNSSNAVAGSVAGAVWYLAEEAFCNVAGNHATFDMNTIQKGIGHTQIENFLAQVPGMNGNVIKQQLANLKASGDYERILKSVQKEANRIAKEEIADLEAEAEYAEEKGNKKAANEARKSLAVTEKKTEKLKEIIEKAKPTPEGKPLYDIEVGTILKTPSVAEAFRKMASGQGVIPYLPVEKQVEFAKHLVSQWEEGKKDNKSRTGDITLSYLRENFMHELLDAKVTQRRINAEEKAYLAKTSWVEGQKLLEREFSRHIHGALTVALKMVRHEDKKPAGVTHYTSGEFRTALGSFQELFSKLKKMRLI
jgi:ParB-like chromosome segregation protein Spo0J